MANVFDNVVGTEHIVAESSLLKATTAGHIYSLKMHADTDNGCLVARGAVATHSEGGATVRDMQVFNSKAYAAGEIPLLVLTTPMGYDSARKGHIDEKYFYNAQGEIARAYELHAGDIFTVSASAITPISSSTGPVMDNYVSFTGGKYVEANSAGQTGFVGQIIEKVNYTNSVSYRILVVKTGA